MRGNVATLWIIRQLSKEWSKFGLALLSVFLDRTVSFTEAAVAKVRTDVVERDLAEMLRRQQRVG